MRKHTCIAAVLCGFLVPAAAKQIQVTALAFTFSPSTFTAAIGDTIRFVWGSGIHTTTSTAVPAGAAAWDAPLDATHTLFLYPVKVGGTYTFQCNFHVLFGMTGTFKVPPRTKVTLVKSVVVNTCTATNSLQYKCTQSTPPFKVQLFRYGIAFGAARTVTDTLPFTFSSLPQGSYVLTARGNNGLDSLSGKSSTKSVVPVPGGVFDKNVRGTTATIKWNHLTCVKFYSVQFRKKGVTAWTKINTTGNKDSLNLTGLSLNTKYQFHVAANDSANRITATSSYSVIDSFQTTATAAVTLRDADDLLNKTNAQATAVVVFPNPARQAFHIKTGSIDFVSAQLRNESGSLVWSAARATVTRNSTTMVPVANLPAGLYYLTLTDGANRTIVKKIAVVK